MYTQIFIRVVNDIDIFDTNKRKQNQPRYDWLNFIYLILKKGPVLKSPYMGLICCANSRGSFDFDQSEWSVRIVLPEFGIEFRKINRIRNHTESTKRNLKNCYWKLRLTIGKNIQHSFRFSCVVPILYRINLLTISLTSFAAIFYKTSSSVPHTKININHLLCIVNDIDQMGKFIRFSLNIWFYVANFVK